MSTETFPSTYLQSDVSLISVGRKPLYTRAQSGRVTVREFGGQHYEISAAYTAVDRDNFEPLLAFLARHREGGDSFRFSLPASVGAPRGSILGTPVAVGGEAVGATAIATTGWTISQTGVLKQRDLIRLTGDTKIYEVTADVNSSGTGTATVNIWPPLIATATAGTLTVNNPYFTVFAPNMIRDPAYSLDGYYSMALIFEEYF